MDFDAAFADLPRGRFEPSLDHRRRCECLALLRSGVRAAVVAKMYGVSRHTVQTMGRDTSPHYRPIRAEFDNLGKKQFCERYLNEDLVNRAIAVSRGEAEAQTGGLRPDPVVTNPYNKRAAKWAGAQRIVDIYDDTVHVTIQWLDDDGPNGAGWYYQLNGTGPLIGRFYTSHYAHESVRLGCVTQDAMMTPTAD